MKKSHLVYLLTNYRGTAGGTLDSSLFGPFSPPIGLCPLLSGFIPSLSFPFLHSSFRRHFVYFVDFALLLQSAWEMERRRNRMERRYIREIAFKYAVAVDSKDNLIYDFSSSDDEF